MALFWSERCKQKSLSEVVRNAQRETQLGTPRTLSLALILDREVRDAGASFQPRAMNNSFSESEFLKQCQHRLLGDLLGRVTAWGLL